MLNLGIGLTSKCNCECSHCYSRIYGNHLFLNKEKIIRFVNTFSVKSVNFGTGESWFHPDFIEILHFLYENGVETSLTSNGYTVSKMSDSDLRLLHDVDFSLDYPEEKLHDSNRQPGCFNMVKDGLERCKRNNVTPSIAWCLTPDNASYIKDMYNLCKKQGVFLRINVYKPIYSMRGFTYEEFWKSMDDLLYYGNIISISEGILNAALNNKNGFKGCNPLNIRIFPDGTMSSCVYVNNHDLDIGSACKLTESELLASFSNQYESVDDICKDCSLLHMCNGGCMARKKIAKSTIDEFCFVQKNDIPSFRRIEYSDRKPELFVHSEYICTIIMEPRKDLE